MVSERMQRQIDLLLDQAEELVAEGDWPYVHEKASAVLVINESDEDALTFIKMAESAKGSGVGSTAEQQRCLL